MEILKMYKANYLKLLPRADLGFYCFIDMPFYASTNELIKACVHQGIELEKSFNMGKITKEK